VRILLAEDERLTRRSLQRQLEAWGHEVVAAEDGAVAWEQYKSDTFEVVISDWEMPNVDGLELIRRVRADDRPEYVYVIMLTARAAKEDLIEGMEVGSDDFLTKPFEKNELRVRLRAGERVIRLERSLAEKNSMLLSANMRMKHDLDAAARVQQSILPKIAPDLPMMACGWQYRPCDELAGDALNLFMLDDRFMCVYVLDVSGHGVPAALLSVAVARSLALSDASVILDAEETSDFRPYTMPAEVAYRLNRRFPFEDNGQRFFTMVYALIDTQSGRLTFCCAGHPGPILLHPDGRTDLMEMSSEMVGIVPNPEYGNETITLATGDRIYFYSDGIVEQFSPSKEQFGNDRLMDSIRRASGGSLEDSIDRVVEDLSAWAGPEIGFQDDVSLVGLQWKGA